MPTEKKEAAVREIQGWLKDTSIIITTDYTGLPVGEMTVLRRTLREKGVRYKVVKNTLTYLAADAAGQPLVKEIVQGPTAIAFGYDDPIEPAKALSEYITNNRSALEIRGAIMDGKLLTAAEIDSLAKLPPKDVLIAMLMGQLQGPIANLANVLNGPISGLARVLQQHSENLAQQSPAEAVAATETSEDTEAAEAAKTSETTEVEEAT